MKRKTAGKPGGKRQDWRWVKIDDERWGKLGRHMETLEADKYPMKLSVNRIASIMLTEAIDLLPG